MCVGFESECEIGGGLSVLHPGGIPLSLLSGPFFQAILYFPTRSRVF